MEPKDPGPDVGQKYELPQKADSLPQAESCHRKSDEDTAFLCEEQQEDASWSPLTAELLTPVENITNVLDPEVVASIANIPRMDDVEMWDMNPPPHFDPEVGCTRYDHNLVWALDEAAPGSNSLVMEREDRMLDEDNQSRAPGTG